MAIEEALRVRRELERARPDESCVDLARPLFNLSGELILLGWPLVEALAAVEDALGVLLTLAELLPVYPGALRIMAREWVARHEALGNQLDAQMLARCVAVVDLKG